MMTDPLLVEDFKKFRAQLADRVLLRLHNDGDISWEFYHPGWECTHPNRSNTVAETMWQLLLHEGFFGVCPGCSLMACELGRAYREQMKAVSRHEKRWGERP